MKDVKALKDEEIGEVSGGIRIPAAIPRLLKRRRGL